MRIGNVTFGQVASLLFVLSLGLPAPAQAVTYWNETFEGNLTPNWDTSSCGGGSFPTGCNPASSTDVAVSGTYSLKGVYNHVGGGAWIDRTFPTTDELYWRVWERFSSDWVWDPGHQVKGFNLGDNRTYPNFWVGHFFGNSSVAAQAQVPAEACTSNPSGNGLPYDNCRYDSSSGQVNNVWYCTEGHILLNTPGVANGVIEFWKNGVLTSHYTGRTFRGSTVTGTNGNSSLATFNFIRVYVQAQAAGGSKYYDDLAVGNTRIGCGAAPVPSNDITPPAPPLGLFIR